MTTITKKGKAAVKDSAAAAPAKQDVTTALSEDLFGLTGLKPYEPKKEVTNFVTEFKTHLRKAHNSRTQVFKTLRSEFPHVRTFLATLAETRGVNTILLRSILQEGNMAALCFFETEEQALVICKETGRILGQKDTTTTSAMVDCLKKAALCPLSAEEIKHIRERLRSENRVDKLIALTDEERVTLGLPKKHVVKKRVPDTTNANLSA